MEARKLELLDHSHAPGVGASEVHEPSSMRQVAGLIHPYVWAWIAVLWIGLACLILYEAG
jgi:hypothetical protein